MNIIDEILGGKSYGLEFKLLPNDEHSKYLKTVVAFANGKGGRLIFGVSNDGKENRRISWCAEERGILLSCRKKSMKEGGFR